MNLSSCWQITFGIDDTDIGILATTLGLKHEIGYNEHWLGAVEALITLPDGSAAFGNRSTGAAFNGIISYTFNPKFNLTLMLGGTTELKPAMMAAAYLAALIPIWF